MDAAEETIDLKIKYKEHLLQSGLKVTMPSSSSQLKPTLPLKLSTILAHINDLLKSHFIVLQSPISILLSTPQGNQNILKLKQNQKQINIELDELGKYQLQIILSEGKQDVVKMLTQCQHKNKKLEQNIHRIIEDSKKTKRYDKTKKEEDEEEIRPIDVAYFFADPLVQISSGGPIAVLQVSYQKQYDKFIQEMKEGLFNNLNVKMQIANQFNIRNTLLEGISIMHFSCHGKKNILKIEGDQRIGEEADLSTERFLKLLQNKIKPKVILFNVCHSKQMAKKINAIHHTITTIGYEGEAIDNYCELFTVRFYRGLLKKDKSVRELFDEIKQEIRIKNQTEAGKLWMFCQTNHEKRILRETQTNIPWIKYWNYIENMRENQPIGIKKEIYNFINKYLVNSQRKFYFFLTGSAFSGKSTFMKKTKIYTMNRNVFNDELYLDLDEIETMLDFRLKYQQLIEDKIKFILQKEKDMQKVTSIIIFDHCEQLIKYYYSKFITFIVTKIFRKIKSGKIVILVDSQVLPQSREEQKSYSENQNYKKQKTELKDKEIKKYIARWGSPDIREHWDTIIKKKTESEPISFLMALKKARSSEEFITSLKPSRSYNSTPLQRIQSQQQKESSQKKMLQESVLQKEESEKHLLFVMSRTEQILSNYIGKGLYKIKQSDFIYLYTMLDLDKVGERKMTGENQKQLVEKCYEEELAGFMGRICWLIREKKDEITYDYIYNFILKVMNFTLKIPLIFHFLGDRITFRHQLLQCYHFWTFLKLYVSPFLKQHNMVNLISELKLYHVKVLLTFYCYFSQKKQNLSNTQDHNENNEKMLEIILEQMKEEFEGEPMWSYLLKVRQMNDMVQQICNKNEYHFIPIRRYTEANDQYLEMFDHQSHEQQLAQIQYQHRKIIKYNDTYNLLLKINSRDIAPKYNSKVLSRNSFEMILIGLMKIINYNLSCIEGLNPLKTESIRFKRRQYAQQYGIIMNQIKKQSIFIKKGKNEGLFNKQDRICLKLLFRQYLQKYIQLSFRIEKINEQTQKQSRSPIVYSQLLALCSQFLHITLPIKREIQSHMYQQYYNNCIILSSIPLVYYSKGNEEKINMKRYEQHLKQFTENLFMNEIDKEIHYELEVLSEEQLRHERDRKVLIYLVICDCKISQKFQRFRKLDNRIYLQNINGESQEFSIQKIQLLDAPIIIMKYHYESHQKSDKNLKTILVLINKPQLKFKEETNEKSIAKSPKKSKVDQFQQISIQNEIYQSVLQFFFTSFCRIFFNQTHNRFFEQFSSSFHLAKAQATLKTKIRFCSKGSTSGLNLGSEIEEAVDTIEFHVINYTAKQIENLGPYHCISKVHKQNIHHSLIKHHHLENQKNRLSGEIGANNSLHDTLARVNQKQQMGELTLIYSNQYLLQEYLKTLKFKLMKNRLFNDIKQYTNEEYIKCRYLLKQESNLHNFKIFHKLDQKNFNLERTEENEQPTDFKLFVYPKDYKIYIGDCERVSLFENGTEESHFEQMLYYNQLMSKVNKSSLRNYKAIRKYEEEMFKTRRIEVSYEYTFEKIYRKVKQLTQKDKKHH